MRTVKNSMKITAILAILAVLFGCVAKKSHVPDKTGMVYKDAENRTVYANTLDFDACEGDPLFAVAFLGYGDRMDFRHTYVEELFASLGDKEVSRVEHVAYEGDEWYLIVPRYKEYVDITNLATGEKHTIYNGEAFTVKCNLSDLHSNIEISTDIHGGHKFSPQIGGDGKLVTNTAVLDITDYSVIQKGE